MPTKINGDIEGERAKLRHIFEAKGLSGHVLEEVVRTISADRELWIQTVLSDEYGLSRTTRSPLTAGGATFVAFIAAGIMPLLPYVVSAFSKSSAHPSFIVSAIAALLAFAVIGTLRGRFADTRWWVSALQTTAIGVAAAGLAYLAGMLFGGLAS